MAANETTHRSKRDPHRHPSAMRVAALMGVLGLVLPILTAARASAAPELLLGRNRFGEYQGVRGEDYLAWQQNTKKHPGHYDVFARPMAGGDAFKVNAAGTDGANGGIEGDLLVYQQFDRGRSDLKFFDLRTKERTSPPAGVNTRRWEYWPSMSGQWLLFGRLAGDGSREIILYDLSTRDATKLDEVGRRDTFLEPGQVNGDYAVWSRCTPGTKCNVILYNIVDGLKTRIPNPGGFQYAPSVSSDGTVTFARSASGCGNRVRLLRYPLGGPATELWRVPSGGDVGTTRIYVNAQGDATLYFDNFACGQPAASDVWQILEQGAIQLSVKVDGSGSVTSSPAGINCGSDCTETYDAVTGVTLTAMPEGGSTFAGWGGACTGSSTTCTLTMNASKSVTATFTNKLITTTATEIHAADHSIVTSSVPLDSTVHDQAVVSGTGAGTPTGTVTFTFFTSGDCTTGAQGAGMVTLVGGVAHPSDTAGPLGAGSYAFRAHYSGDSNYSESTSACEPLTVS
jgi:hypothetical protein